MIKWIFNISMNSSIISLIIVEECGLHLNKGFECMNGCKVNDLYVDDNHYDCEDCVRSDELNWTCETCNRFPSWCSVNDYVYCFDANQFQCLHWCNISVIYDNTINITCMYLQWPFAAKYYKSLCLICDSWLEKRLGAES